MRIIAPRLAVSNVRQMGESIERWATSLVHQLNAISEERLHGHHNAITAAPTTGDYAVGDFVRNSTPSELGSAGSKYVITGWVCVTAGTPGTWLACRCLTGN
jgi:hypothetical protein